MSVTNIPTVQESIDECLAFLESNMGQEAAINNKAFLLVLSRLQGMIKTSLYMFTVEQMKRVLAVTAEDDDLERIGNQYNVYRKPSVAAVLEIGVTGDTPGQNVSITTTWNAKSNGVRYFQNQDYTISGGGEANPKIYAEDVGDFTTLKIGDTVSIGSPIEGLDSNATVEAVVTPGADQEEIEDYRVRVLDELQTVGGGSDSADLRSWAQQTPGVKRAYPYTGNLPHVGSPPFVETPGNRTVFIESSSDPDGIADQPLLDSARGYITTNPDTGRSRQALGSTDETLYVKSITRLTFNLVLRDLTVAADKLAQCKADIETEVDAFLRDFSTYIEGLDPSGFRNNYITAVAMSEVVQDVVESYNGFVESIVVENASIAPGVTIGNYTLNPGEKAKGTVSYVTS